MFICFHLFAIVLFLFVFFVCLTTLLFCLTKIVTYKDTCPFKRKKICSPVFLWCNFLSDAIRLDWDCYNGNSVDYERAIIIVLTGCYISSHNFKSTILIQMLFGHFTFVLIKKYDWWRSLSNIVTWLISCT